MLKNSRYSLVYLAACLIACGSWLAPHTHAQQPAPRGNTVGRPAATGAGAAPQTSGAHAGGGFQTQPIQAGRLQTGAANNAPQTAQQPGMRATAPAGAASAQQLGAQQLGAQQQQQQGLPGQAQPAPGQSTPVDLNEQQTSAMLVAQQQQIAGGVVNPVSPFPPLNKEWQDWLDQVLTKWELESGKVQKFECEFARFQYDPTLVEKHHNTVATGVLKYMAPDKGLFKVNNFMFYAGTKKDSAGVEQPQYEINKKKVFGEYWICDGEYVHILDQNEKKCIKQQLPPNMRGNAIHLSPLPFVFGVKKQELEARYWINYLPAPKDRKDELWLEVYPRRADDAANYKKLQVVLDLKDWMPKGLIVFLPNWRPESPHRELYQFENRQVNAKNLLPQIFQKEFIPGDVPKDWKVIVEPYQAGPPEQPADQPRVATPPQPGAPVLK